MSTSTFSHPFDSAVALVSTGAVGIFQGQVSQDYWNMVGPYGGITAATLVQALAGHPQCLGDPVSITVNYAAAMGAGRFEIEANPVRTNRSTQHWLLTVRQAGEDGMPQIVTTATAVTALRRPTWGGSDLAMPRVAPAQEMPAGPQLAGGPVWLGRYETRFVEGMPPQQWDDAEAGSLTQMWVRDHPPRPLDFASLAALSDIFFPRVWLRRARRTPAGTVSITVYFHASREDLAEAGTAPLLAQARGQEFRNGFFDQTAQLWSASGRMLASSHQIVYFKE